MKGSKQVLVRPNRQTSPNLTADVLTTYNRANIVSSNSEENIADITLEDPEYHESLPMDMMFGANVFLKFLYLLNIDRRKSSLNEPVTFSTIVS